MGSNAQPQWYWDRDALAAAIAEHGTVTAAANATGVSRSTLKDWVERHKLNDPRGLPSPPATAAPRDAEPAELVSMRRQVERAEAQAKSLKAQLRHAVKHENVVEDVRDMLAPVIAQCVIPKPQRPKMSRSRSRKPLTLVWHLSDLHWGELVEASVLNDVNAYSPAIAAARLQHTFDTILVLADNYDHRHGVDELVIAVNGDTIGGAIHPDSAEYYARVGRQTLDAALVLAQIATEASMVFPKVRLLGTVGNHPRSTHRMPTGKARVETSWEWLLHEQVATLLANVPNVSFEMARGYTLDTMIGPSRWAFSHGDAVKGGGGSLGMPAYGLKRQHDAAREWSMVLAQINEQATSTIVKHSRFGHFHTYLAWQAGAADIALAPSPKGVDPFVKDVLGKYSPPQFLVEVVHPEHDVIAHHPIDLTAIQSGRDDCRYLWNEDGYEGMAVDVMREWRGR
jgi:transposase-like protein